MINPRTWEMPEYPTFFPADDILCSGMEWQYEINQKITGTLAMQALDAGFFAQAIANAGHGDHLEIGSLFGGSAILAAFVKQSRGLSGKVVCLDDLEMTGQNYIDTNARLLGVSDWLEVYIGKSHPFPFDNNRRFRTTLIDASHDEGWCRQDWYNARNHTDKYIIFHDYDPQHPGVVIVAREAMQEWRAVFLAEHTLVLERP